MFFGPRSRSVAAPRSPGVGCLMRIQILASFAFVSVSILVACEAPAEMAPVAAPAMATANAAPTMTAAPIAMPVVKDLGLDCHTDDDCVVTSKDISGVSTCCAGCTWHPSSKNSMADFTKSCIGAPTQACKPVDCKMPLVSPKCIAAKCSLGAAGSSGADAGM